VEDLIGLCGNMPGLDRNPHFQEGRVARRQWLLETIEKYGTAGVLAYDNDTGRAVGFVESIPAAAHPLGRFSADLSGTMVIDCAWYRQDAGVAVRKAILDHMFASNWFDVPVEGKCRFVDVLTLKNAPLMQYDFYIGYGFMDAVEMTGHATKRYLLRYPVMGDEVTPRVEEIKFCDAGRNVLVIGIYRQCHMPFIWAAQIQKAVEGIEGLSVKIVDYWATGAPTICEAAINGKPAFDGVVAFMNDDQIREAVRSKMV
jgi:hypothetical protein